MREIRFRAWFHKSTPDSNGDFMLYSPGVRTEGSYPRVVHYPESLGGSFSKFWENIFGTLGEVSVMQWTGLFDKVGVPIFEGDVVRNVSGKLFWVQWDVQGFELRTIPENKFQWGAVNFGLMEVVGNRFEEPELLNNAPSKE